jgi:predicted nucleotidyltransferase
MPSFSRAILAINDPDLANGLKRLISYCEGLGIKMALVGALAPAVLISGPVKGAMSLGSRETRDVDSVVELQSWDEWKTFIEGLTRLGFERSAEEHRLHYGQAQFDLVPYGGLVTAGQVLTWPSSKFKMNMMGMSDALNSAKLTEVLPGVSLPVAPLWSIVVLKIAAYQDRGYPRDLTDIVYIADEFERSDPQTRRYDVLDRVTIEQAGAYLLGLDVKTFGSAESVAHSKDFLKSIADEYDPIIAVVLREESRAFSDDRRSYVYNLFKAIYIGLQ